MGRESQLVFSLPESELILTAAIFAVGATRQASSHIKACIGFGIPEMHVVSVMQVAGKFAKWQGQGQTLPELNISGLAEAAKAALA